MADASGYAVLAGQPAAQVKEVHEVKHWGGGAAWVLVWVVIIIFFLALLAALFWNSGSWLGGDSSSDDNRDSRHGKGGWDLSLLGGLVVFIIVILFICWLIGSAGGMARA
jgi:Zn-dependent protease with chaperone function